MTTKENTYDPGLTCVVPSSNTGMEKDLVVDMVFYTEYEKATTETSASIANEEWEQYKKRHLQTAQKIVAFMHSHD